MDKTDRRITGLTTLLTLEREARHARDPEALGFLMVNETLRLLRYSQALFWRRDPSGRVRIQAFSGLARFDADAPQVVWLTGVIAALAREEGSRSVRRLDVRSVDADLGRDWTEQSPAHVLWLPLHDAREGAWLGGLWLARDAAWEEGEATLGEHWADACGHALAGLEGRTRPRRFRPGRAASLKLLGVMALLALLFTVPVRQSVLAPASVAAVDPAVVAAPMDGVVARFHVEPNQPVTPGQLLLELDATEQLSHHQVNLEELEVARAAYQKALRQAFGNPDSGADLASLADRAAAQAEQSQRQLERLRIHARTGGVAVFADVNDWLGRPVRVGERLLFIADPRRVEVEIRLPVADALVLEPGAAVRLFLNTDPLHPLPATLRYASYEAGETPEGVLAHHLRATFPPGAVPPRLGLKGTAKVYGGRVPIALYLFRRPLSALRRLLGI